MVATAEASTMASSCTSDAPPSCHGRPSAMNATPGGSRRPCASIRVAMSASDASQRGRRRPRRDRCRDRVVGGPRSPAPERAVQGQARRLPPRHRGEQLHRDPADRRRIDVPIDAAAMCRSARFPNTSSIAGGATAERRGDVVAACVSCFVAVDTLDDASRQSRAGAWPAPVRRSRSRSDRSEGRRGATWSSRSSSPPRRVGKRRANRPHRLRETPQQGPNLPAFPDGLALGASRMPRGRAKGVFTVRLLASTSPSLCLTQYSSRRAHSEISPDRWLHHRRDSQSSTGVELYRSSVWAH